MMLLSFERCAEEGAILLGIKVKPLTVGSSDGELIEVGRILSGFIAAAVEPLDIEAKVVSKLSEIKALFNKSSDFLIEVPYIQVSSAK